MSEERPHSTSVKAKALLFGAIVVAWIALDQYTKSLFATMTPGQSKGIILGGLVDIRLVHNTGAAWGIFADNTSALGIFSLVVVGLLIAYFIWDRKNITVFQTIGIALIVAGGIGNAIDRFAQGFVTDFIAVTFVDFPLLNVADIGVTCGVIILFLGIILKSMHDSSSGESQ